MPQDNHRWITPASTVLFKTILKLENLKQAQNFFRDLMSEKEIRELSNRWKTAQMLEKGISFSVIEKQTGMSPNTIARINKWRKKGMGGYRLMLGKK
ncbi:hypothetical protein HQ571_06110 [Candidatus Kuenenbacteria bacterium]|nr:hypothetical protein [Candidatus Kuenenbacteria bacterium]